MAKGGGGQEESNANLLHDASLSLGESDVATRLILNEFDLDLSSLATWLVIIVIIVISRGTHARTFGAATFEGTVAGSSQIILGRRRFVVSDIGDIGHGE